MTSRLYRSNGKLVVPVGPFSPDSYPAYATPYDDEFEGISLDAKWAWFNQGAASAAQAAGAVTLTLATEAAGTWRGIQQSVPSGNWRIAARLAASISTTNSQSTCLSIREDSTAKTLALIRQYTVSALTWTVVYYTNNTTFSATLWSSTTLLSSGWPFRQWGYFAIEYDGTNYYFDLSSDGIAWTRVATAAKASYFTADKMALGIRNGNSGQTFSFHADWFRRVA